MTSPSLFNVNDPFGGFSGFGFEVPQGDPGAIDAAASGVRRLAGLFTAQGRNLTSAAQIAVNADGGWRGTAAGAYGEASGRVSQALSADAGTCEQVAGHLGTLARALEQAQRTTRQALAECQRAQTELTTQQGAANEAAQLAENASTAAATAVHPAERAALNQQAQHYGEQASAAQRAVHQAQTDLEAAENRGRQAFHAYVREAEGIARAISGAAGELRSPPTLAGGAPIPVSVSPAEASQAAALTAAWAAGKTSGPLLDYVPANERTPGLIVALLEQQRETMAQDLQAGGAKPPYSLWSNQFFGNATGAVNAEVKASLMPPMPSNWGSMTGGQQQAYLSALHRLYPGISCPMAGACNFGNATGTGARTPGQVVSYVFNAPINVATWIWNHPTQAAEAGGLVVCTLATSESGDVPCVVAGGAAFGVDTGVNALHAQSMGDFLAHEGVSAAETVVMGGGGLIRTGLGLSEKLSFRFGDEVVSVLPASRGGRIALNAFFNGPSAATTAMSSKIEHTIFPTPAHPAPPPHHHKP